MENLSDTQLTEVARKYPELIKIDGFLSLGDRNFKGRRATKIINHPDRLVEIRYAAGRSTYHLKSELKSFEFLNLK